MRPMIVSLVSVLLVCVSPCAAQPQHDRIMKVDVVELIGKGQDVEGKPDFAATYGKFTYWFANEDNLMVFLMNEDKYAIQYNGACARMGPLSGDGTPRLFTVHDGKVYIFASEQCKAGFERDPMKFVDMDDASPQPSEEERKRGRLLLGKAVDSFACTAGIDNLITLRQVAESDQASGGQTYHVTRNITFMFPDAVFREDCWNDSCWAFAGNSTQGWAMSHEHRESMNAQQRTALLRTTGRHPITILRHRNDKELIISATGETKKITIPVEGDMEVELVHVHRAGATTTLGIHASGRILLMAYQGRAGGSSVGHVECIYSDFHNVDGVRLARRMDVHFNGTPMSSESLVFTEQVLNDPNDLAKIQSLLNSQGPASVKDSARSSSHRAAAGAP